jgi:hypothetical protein
MNTYLKNDEWCIIEDSFIPDNTRASESIFSIGKVQWAKGLTSKKSIAVARFRVAILVAFTTPTKPAWAGGKMVTQILCQGN